MKVTFPCCIFINCNEFVHFSVTHIINQRLFSLVILNTVMAFYFITVKLLYYYNILPSLKCFVKIIYFFSITVMVMRFLHYGNENLEKKCLVFMQIMIKS